MDLDDIKDFLLCILAIIVGLPLIILFGMGYFLFILLSMVYNIIITIIKGIFELYK